MPQFRDLTDADFMRWGNFSRAEFVCKCGCNRCCMDPAFMDKLQNTRTLFGRPMSVTSGFRCSEHNAAVSHTGAAGPHTTGKAVDIAIARGDAYDLLSLALAAGFTGIGVSQKGASRFLHLDTLDAQEAAPGPRPTIWSY